MRKTLAAAGGLAALVIAAGCSSSDSGNGKAAGDDGTGSAGGSAAQPSSSAQQQSGGGAQGGGSTNALVASYQSTSAKKTAKVTQTLEMRLGSRPLQVFTAGTGVVDFGSGAAQIVTTKGPVAEVRYVGGAVYERFPAALGKAFGVTTPWAKIDTSKLAPGASQASSQMSQGAGSSPLDPLSYLQGASDSITTVGTESVDGTSTTHYRAVVDLDKAAAKVGGAFEKTIKDAETSGLPKTQPIDVWVDGQHQVRKEIVVTQATGKVPFGTRLTLMFSDFGTPAQVAAPPANQTTDITAKLTAGH